MARRKGAENSDVRMALIDCAIEIIRNEGCAAVTAGRLARKLGLGRHIVHYYFGTMEDLFLAIMRQEGEKTKRWYEEILTSDRPVRLIWEHSGPADPRTFEYLAMALRSEAIEAEVRRSTEELRLIFTRAIERYLDNKGFKCNVPPVSVGIVVLGIARTLASGDKLGVDVGHAATKALVEGWINTFEQTGQWPDSTTGRFD